MSQSQEIFRMKTPFGVKTVDCTYEMPTGYGAGYSKDGETVYLDCRLKRIFKLKDGRLMDTTKYVVFHESGEKFYEDKYGYKYPYAHEKITGLERKEVESDNFPWDEYQSYILKEIKLIKKLDADAPMPENFDDKPERDSHDYSLIKTMQKHQKFHKPETLVRALVKICSAVKTKPYAVVDKIFTNDWKPIFRWADSESHTFKGEFKTEEEVIKAIPLKYKKIILQYMDEKGNEVNKTINR